MSVTFAGSDVVTASSNAGANVFSAGGSLAFWMRWTSYGGSSIATIAAKGDLTGTTQNGWTLALRNQGAFSSAMQFHHDTVTTGAGADWSVTVPTSGVWHHVVVSYDGTSSAANPDVYIDGSSVAVTEDAAPVGNPTTDASTGLYIGAQATGFAWDYVGDLEDFRIVNRLITKQEASLLAAGYRGPIGGEVFWLDMENVGGVVASSAFPSIKDKSIGRNNATPQGSIPYAASTAPRYG